jgi:hypothetical protein
VKVNGAVVGLPGELKEENIYAELTAAAQAAPEEQQRRTTHKQVSLTIEVYQYLHIKEEITY